MDPLRSEVKLQELRQIASLAHCPDRELTALANVVEPCQFPAGAVITTESRYGAETFIIVEGTAEVSIGGQVIGYIRSGEFVGEMSSIDLGLRSATVKALTKVDALIVNQRDFTAMLEQPCINGVVIRGLVARLRYHDERLLAESVRMNQTGVHPSGRDGEQIQVIR